MLHVLHACSSSCVGALSCYCACAALRMFNYACALCMLRYTCVVCIESKSILLWALDLDVFAMQRILQLTEDQMRAILSHRRMYITHMAQLSKLRRQLLQQLHVEPALELSNGELDARQTSEDQILRQLENCTVQANRQYFDYVGAVGHDVSLLPACGMSSPPTKPPPSPPTLFFTPLTLATPLHSCLANQSWNHNTCKCHQVCSYLAVATLLVLDDDH